MFKSDVYAIGVLIVELLTMGDFRETVNKQFDGRLSDYVTVKHLEFSSK